VGRRDVGRRAAVPSCGFALGGLTIKPRKRNALARGHKKENKNL
jgi:hypothetical protein